ncbi:hypothetical protein D1871_11120 [Nakamurella silvestris]|nr:hypothetical protein D1871_11120 [Nakamurella silvestris]
MTQTEATIAPAEPKRSILSDLDRLTQIAEIETSRTVTLPINGVKGREGVALVVQVGTVENDRLTKMRVKAAGGKKDGDMNVAYWHSLILATYTEQIVIEGKPLLDDEGDPITFTTKAFQDALDVETAAEAAKRFISLDGKIIGLGVKLLAEAGFGDDDIEAVENPTNG